MSQKFIDVGSYSINADRILYVKQSETAEGECIVVLDAGEPLRLNKKDSETLRWRLIMLKNPRPYVAPVSEKTNSVSPRKPIRWRAAGQQTT